MKRLASRKGREGRKGKSQVSWQVICGNTFVELLKLKEASVDFIFTDPPYGHHNNDGDLIHRREAALGRGKCGKPRPIASDGGEANGLVLWTYWQAKRLLRTGGCCCCCGGGGGPDPQFARWANYMNEALDFVQMIVWDKGPIGLGWHYRRSYETVMVGKKPGGKMRWYDNSHIVENIIRPGHGIKKIIPSAAQHPTEKPVGLPWRFILLHTRPGDLVLDPFCGSGSTGVAAVQAGRRFLGIELDPHWATVARKRIAAAATAAQAMSSSRPSRSKLRA